MTEQPAGASPASPIRLVVVNGGVSDPSTTKLLAERTAASVRAQAERSGAEVTVHAIDLRELAQELPAALTTGLLGPRFAAAEQALTQADGVIAAAPVYKAGASALFTGFFQVLDNDLLIGKPVLLAATAGSVRHALVVDGELRSLFAYLRALVTPTALFATSEDWGSGSLGDRIERAAGELLLLVRSGFAREVRERSWGSYQHSLGSAGGTETAIALDTDLMRLATGGSLGPAAR